MSKPKGLALIAAGHVLSVGGGLAAVAVNELFMPADVAQTSPGMVAFGDMVLFVLVTGLARLKNEERPFPLRTKNCQQT